MILYNLIEKLLEALRQVIQEVTAFTLQILSTPGHIFEPRTWWDHIKSVVFVLLLIWLWIVMIPVLSAFGILIGLYLIVLYIRHKT